MRDKANDRITEYAAPWVEEHGAEPFRYRVQSSDGNSFHLVDLTERGGHGACDCYHFQFTANVNFRRLGGEWIPYAPGRAGVTECTHLAAAFAHFHKHVTVPMLAKMRHGLTSSPRKPQ